MPRLPQSRGKKCDPPTSGNRPKHRNMFKSKTIDDEPNSSRDETRSVHMKVKWATKYHWPAKANITLNIILYGSFTNAWHSNINSPVQVQHIILYSGTTVTKHLVLLERGSTLTYNASGLTYKGLWHGKQCVLSRYSERGVYRKSYSLNGWKQKLRV